MIVNPQQKELRIKIVYYGPVISGKTTNVLFISRYYPGPKGHLAQSEGMKGMTVVFDLLPIEIPLIKGFRTRVFLYTVPGQYFFKSVRRMVLRGADGVVFVADSQADRLEENKQYLGELFEGLRSYGLVKIPIVLQYNKQDMDKALAPRELDRLLNPYRFPSIPAIAVRGKGVFKTLETVLRYVVRHQVVPAVRRAQPRHPSGGFS